MGKGINGNVLMDKCIRHREHIYKEEQLLYANIWSNAYGGAVFIWRRICMEEKRYMTAFKGGPTQVERVGVERIHSGCMEAPLQWEPWTRGDTTIVGATRRVTNYGRSDLVMKMFAEWKTDIKN